MSRIKKLVHELHRRSLWQVLGIYAAASWVALQVVDQLQESLELPGWISGAAVVLLILGLPIVLATAFVQEGVERTSHAREAADGGGTTDGPERLEAGGSRDTGVTTPAPEPRLHHRVLSWRNALLGGGAAFLLMFGIAGLYVVIRDRGRAFAPDDAVAVEIAPGIAVLPFSVSGPGVEFWREGMAQTLALNLDGLAGLRTIDSRTVLTRWEDRLGDRSSLDLEEALEVARAAGGRYALLGDLVSSGSRLQVAVAVYDVESGERLDRVQVEGAAAEDSIFALVNRLTLQALRVLPRTADADAPQVDLARLTTDSIAALRAFLEGETHFRHEDYGPAIEAFARAVEIDSTFALAHYRLSLAYGWRDNASGTGGHNRKAVEYADRLSERGRLLVRSHLAYSEGRAYDAYRALDEVTRKYPDEVEGWYLLGETLYHLGDEALRDPAESRRAFERVAEIDPGFLPGQEHRVETAFTVGDSAGVRALLALDWGDQPQIPLYRISRHLAWGTPTERDSALAALDGMPANSLSWVAIVLDHPTQLAIQDSVLGRAAARAGEGEQIGPRSLNYLKRGKVAAFRSLLEHAPGTTPPAAMAPFVARTGGYDVPPSLLELGLARGRALGPGAWLTLMTTYLIDQGREEELDALEARRRAALDSLTAVGSGLAAAVEGSGRLVRAYRLWRREGPEAAADSLVAAQRAVTGWFAASILNSTIRWWTAEALVEAGRDEEAEPYYVSVFHGTVGAPLQAVAAERLARLYDARGDLDKAAEYYAVFTDMWKDADPELQPRVEAARTRLQEILAERG